MVLMCQKAQGQLKITAADTTFTIVLDSMRAVYIYADTGKAINRVDAAGRKQGLWEQKYSNGNIRYRGHFKDDKPYGVFKYYYEANDSLRILAIYSDNGRVARVHEYYSSGAMAGAGKFVDEKKDSVWKTYDELQELRLKEQYANGKKEGKSMMFFPLGGVVESKTWHNDLENGKWQQFYDNGDLKMEATYVDGKLQGPSKYYFPGGIQAISGSYVNDMKEGEWVYYDENGNPKDSLIFKNGNPADKSKMIRTQHQLDSLKQKYETEDQQRPKQMGEDDNYYEN